VYNVGKLGMNTKFQSENLKARDQSGYLGVGVWLDNIKTDLEELWCENLDRFHCLGISWLAELLSTLQKVLSYVESATYYPQTRFVLLWGGVTFSTF